MIRAVLDANVFVSAVLSPRGTPAKVLDSWYSFQFSLVVSHDILQEIERVLLEPGIRVRHRWSKQRLRAFLDDLANVALFTQETPRLAVVDDEPDNRYLECALAGHAEYIVSGDRDLLSLGEYQGILILTPREFLGRLERSSEH